MNHERNLGKLYFLIAGSEQKINIYWDIFEGRFEQNSWKASVSFSEEFGVSQKALTLLTKALEDSTIQIFLELDSERRYECVVHSIIDLADGGIIEISSPQLGRARFIAA